jgi:hypothetical protein
MNINTAKIESLVRQLLLEIGEDPERERLLKTPGAGARRVRNIGPWAWHCVLFPDRGPAWLLGRLFLRRAD